MFLKLFLVYLMVGCILSIWLMATGRMNLESEKGIMHYVELILIVLMTPALFPIAIIIQFNKK